MDKILNLIGLATRAGATVNGEFMTEKMVKARKAKLVIVAADASDNTKKLFKDKTKYYGIPIYIYADKESLGKSMGKHSRASLAIMDTGFKNALEKLLKDGGIIIES